MSVGVALSARFAEDGTPFVKASLAPYAVAAYCFRDDAQAGQLTWWEARRDDQVTVDPQAVPVVRRRVLFHALETALDALACLSEGRATLLPAASEEGIATIRRMMAAFDAAMADAEEEWE